MPPLPTGNVPVTLLARSMSAVEIAPAVAFRNPVRLPMESEPKNPDVDDAYDDVIAVEDAYGTCEALVDVAVK